MDFLRSTGLRVSLIAAALLLSTTIASAEAFTVNNGQLFVVYTLDTGGGPGTLTDGMGTADYAQDYVVTLLLDGLNGLYPNAMGATSSPSAGEFLPGFNPSNEFFVIGWTNANTDLFFNPMIPGLDGNPEDHLILGGPDASAIVGPGNQDDIVAGLKLLGSDPMFLGMNGVQVENATDFWNRFGGTFLGDQILLPAGMGGEPTNSGQLMIDGFNALVDQEIAGFSSDGLGGIMVTNNVNGKVQEVMLENTDGGTTTFIPEPGLATLFVLAVAGVALRRRRRAA